MNGPLRRNQNEEIIGGVAAGIGDYVGIDTWIIRIIFLILLFSGSGLLIYLIMWIAIPKDTNQKTNYMDAQVDPKPKKADSGNIIAGVLLITIGALFLLDRYFPEIDFRDIWPWSLIIVGVLLLFKGIRKNNY